MARSQGTPCVVLIVFAWVTLATATNPVGPFDVVLTAVVSVVAAGVAVRSLLLRVVVGEAGVRVVNFFWSRFVPWEDVERFEIDYGEHSPSIHGFVVCRDGSRVPITALQTRWLQSAERARRRGVAARRVAELNRLLAARRGEPLPGWPLPRRLSSPLTGVLLWGGLGAVAAAVAAAVPGADERWGLLLLAGLAAVPAGLWRLRVRVRADEQGLLLAGWWRSRRVAWQEVDGFETARRWRRLPARRLVVACRGGVRVPAAALTSWLGSRGGLDRKAAELAEILEDRRRAVAGATAGSRGG